MSDFLFHRRTVMVGMETVRAIHGVDTDRLLEWVAAGRFRWVWDISARPRSAGAGIREIRFWLREVVAPELCRGLEPPGVIASILGDHRQRWPATEVAQMFLCSRPAMMRLAEAGELHGPIERGVRWIPRSSLDAFLVRRLVW